MPKKRKDGLRERKVTINGKRISVYGHSVDEIDEKIKKLKQDAEQGIQADKTMTLDKMYQVWLRNRSIKESTLAEYNKKYQSISKHIGSMKLTDITPQTCDNLKEMLKNDDITRSYIKQGEKITEKRGKLTSAGVNNRLGMLRGILQLATDRRLIPYNPMAGIYKEKRKEPKMRDNKHRALTINELTMFLKESERSDYYNIMRFMAYTGMRCGEAAALTWGDITKDSAHITKTTSREKGGKVVVNPTPKTGASIRYVPLNENAQRVLSDQKKRLMMLIGGNALKDDAIIFPKSRGGLIDSTVINTCILQIIRRINRDNIRIEPFTPHAFRHTFATMCVNMGMKPQTLQKILGHATISMTMDLYYHTDETQKKEEMSKIKFAF